MSTTTFATITSSRNPALRQALESVPGYAETDAALRAAKAALNAEAARPATAPAHLAGELVEIFRAADAVPDDLGDQALAATLEPQRRKAALHVLDDARRRLEDEHDDAIRAGSNAVFQSLNSQLADVIERHADLDPATTAIVSAEAAIASGKTDAFQDARMIGTQYAAIREAQQLALFSFSGGDRSWTDAHAVIKNIDDVWAEWLPWRRIGSLINPRTRQAVRLTPPWPDEPGLAFLNWARDAEAELWIPTPRKLREHYKTSAAAMQLRWYGRAAVRLAQQETRVPNQEVALVPADVDLPQAS